MHNRNPNILLYKVLGFTGVSALLLVLVIATACGDDPADGETSLSESAAPAAVVSTTAPPAPSSAAAQAASQQKLQIVTTSNIVTDWVSNIGGDRVDVFSILPPNADPHTFQPGARDIAKVADADMVFTIGLSLEAGWLDDLVKNAARDHDDVIAVGDVVDTIGFVQPEEGHHDEDDEDHDHGADDPHFWFDPIRVKRAITDVAARLSVADPENGDIYRANAAAYNSEIDELHAWIEDLISHVPEDRRLIVTSHNSFGYLEDRYGVEIVGAVIPGGSTDREPSAQEMADLIDAIRDAGATALFTETTVSDTLANRVAEESGAQIVNGLYTGSLSYADGDAATYLDMMRYNVAIILEALR